LVFNAFTLLLLKLMEEWLGDDPRMLPLVGSAAFLATLCGALTQFTVGRMIDRMTLKRVFLPVSALLVPALVAVSYAHGWIVVPMAALVATAIFGQVTVNETMTARYLSPALRTRMYSVRFFVGFLGAAAAAPVVAWLHERTGSLAVVTLVMAGFGVVTLGCALAFPDRKEELRATSKQSGRRLKMNEMPAHAFLSFEDDKNRRGRFDRCQPAVRRNPQGKCRFSASRSIGRSCVAR
jgi:MFS family permease